MYESECLIVRRFKMLSHEKDISDKNLDEKIKEIESLLNITYNEEQLQAIKESYLKKFLIRLFFNKFLIIFTRYIYK